MKYDKKYENKNDGRRSHRKHNIEEELINKDYEEDDIQSDIDSDDDYDYHYELERSSKKSYDYDSEDDYDQDEDYGDNDDENYDSNDDATSDEENEQSDYSSDDNKSSDSYLNDDNVTASDEKTFNSKHKKYLTFEKRFISRLSTTIVSFVLSILFVVLSIRMNVENNIKYYQTSNLDYKVNLKENSYYQQKTLGKDMQYIASLIDNIDVTFDYNFKTSDKLNYRYNYYINAEVKVTDPDTDNTILTKRERITQENNVYMSDSDNFNINEKVKIDYDKYNNIAKNFKSDYAISADSNLILTLYVNIIDEEGNALKTLNANNSMTMTIPLTEKMINISMDYKEINNSSNITAHTKVMISSYPLLISSIVLFIVFVVSLISLIKFLIRVNRKKTIYDKTLSRILREYDRIIVEPKSSIINSENKDIINVKSFEELLDARDNLEKPIIFNEIHKGAKSEFYVKNNYEIYRYVLKLVDLEKEKNHK